MMLAQALSLVGIDVGNFTCVSAVHGRTGVTSFAPYAAGIAQLLERITLNLIQIEGDPRQASRWLCCVSPLNR